MKQVLSGNHVTAMMNESGKGRSIVIGGGFGGLAVAIRLQAAGSTVTLIEAREKLGGRAYQIKEDGFTFDMGPTLITAPHLLEDLWAAASRSLKEDVPIVPLSPCYRIYFRDGRYFALAVAFSEQMCQIASTGLFS